MRKTIKTAAVVSGMAAVFALGGCGGERDPSAMTADLERDLQLATAAEGPRTAVVSALEGGPIGAPSGDRIGRRDAVAIPRRTARPTPSAPTTETVASASVNEAPAAATVTTEQVEPTPSPRPEPGVIQGPPDLSTEAVSTSGPSARGDDNDGRDRGTNGGCNGSAISPALQAPWRGHGGE